MSLYSSLSTFFEKFHEKKKRIYLNNIFINTLIDVGAHEANFLKNINEKNLINVYMFEPNLIKFNQLIKTFPSFKIYNIALSNRKNIENFLICDEEDTNSTLESAINKNSFFFFFKTKFLRIKYNNVIQVQLDKLDNIFKNELYLNSFLKIDTEGSDLEVLYGGIEFIKKINYILIEVKKYNFYKNCKKKNICSFLLKNNFKIKKIFSSFPYHYEDILFERNLD